MQPLYTYIPCYRGEKNREEMNKWLLSHMKATTEILEQSIEISTSLNEVEKKLEKNAAQNCSYLTALEKRINYINKKLLKERSDLL